MQHVLIVTGGYLNIDFAKAYVKTLSFDKVFAVDKGLEYVHALGILPNYIIGDFDTVDKMVLQSYAKKIHNQEINTIIERYPSHKDATDTELAVDKAIEMGADCITILAVTGTRMDHVLANIGLLIQANERKVKAYLVDETNRIQLISADSCSSMKIFKQEQYGTYLSLLPVTAQVKGVTLQGALYPLECATLYRGSSFSVSNEIQGDVLEIEIEQGAILVIESKDTR